MRCVNCNAEFEAKGKGYRRTSLLSEKRSEAQLKGIFGVDVTPKTEKNDGRFLCPKCEKQMKVISEGLSAKHELFRSQQTSSYLGSKRKGEPSGSQASPKRQKFESPRKHRKLSSGAKYLCQYNYKQGFRYFLKKSKKARKALREIIAGETRKGMRTLLNIGSIPNTAGVSVNSFKSMSFKKLTNAVKSSVPYLYSSLLSAISKLSEDDNLMQHPQLQTIMGTLLSVIVHQLRPRKASLLQKMNAIQMWRAGCRRSLFQNFNRLGVCVSESTMLSTLDLIKNSFDAELMQWKHDLQEHIHPDISDSPTPAFECEVPGPSESSPFTDLQTSSPTASSYSASTDDSPDEEWEDMPILTVDDEEGEETIPYADDDTPKGYTLCWDNVGKHVKARHQTRNSGNRYKCWALAFVAKNRIKTTHYDDIKCVPASSIPIEKFFISASEANQIREELILTVQRILCEYIEPFKPLKDNISQGRHIYDAESCQKSELFNVGVLNENPSSIGGVVNIIEQLHKYVPKKADGSPFKLLTWGDGLSCERHVDAQHARANGGTAFTRLQGLEPAPQEFHKRMLLMQDTMDKMFDGKSAAEKGTLFQLKNLLNHRSVSKNVSESFNYVSEFLKFVTEGYVLLFALDILKLNSLDVTMDEIDSENFEETVEEVSVKIVDTVWNTNALSEKVASSLAKDAIDYEYCTCKEEIEGAVMIECENEACPRGQWFHLECEELNEHSLPEYWFCSTDCKRESNKPSDSELDGKFEYVKKMTWRGLCDLARRDAVRKNNGVLMTLYWKADMVEFLLHNHTKYLILGHRLIANLNGFQQERLRQDLMWNRTINLRGGRNNNIETDLVNEFLNKEFKESLGSSGTQLTEATLARHGQLTGGVGQVMDQVYDELKDIEKHPSAKTIVKRHEDMKFLVGYLMQESLTVPHPGRFFKSFPKVRNSSTIDMDKMVLKLQKMSKKLDRSKRVSCDN